MGAFIADAFEPTAFFTDDVDSPIELRDAVWRWRRRLQRQKCSVISIQLDDDYSDGPGFTLTAIALEIGKKPGLDRIPWRGGVSSTPAGQVTIKNGR